MFVTADQLFAHAVGDYVFQTNQMAQGKTRTKVWACAHAIWYMIPFLVLCQPSMVAWIVMVASHAVIDHWSLGRKLKPMPPKPAVGPDPVSESLRTWLPIICDNILHVSVNAAALRWL
ncbi:MAG: DUF3307 domain-containing protein [Acidobacteriales bacterium]|nr:DUF3307 domain-containing protein [Terriglobales bacterium]